MPAITLFASKIIAAIIVFFLALLSGLFPIRFFDNHKQHLLSIGDAFAGGVFLSAALIHMIPNAEANFRVSLPNSNYPLALLLITVFFILLFLLEHGALLFSKRHLGNRGNPTPYLLTILIMIHAILEGAAIGINTSLVSFSIIFFAVLAHKGSETFALSINLRRYKIACKSSAFIIGLVSLMTPLGIFITTEIGVFLQNSSGQLVTAILNSLAAATFLYLGTVHVIAEPDHIVCRCGILALLAGMALMAIVAIWV
jgi:solute carrier family 39 (zinc transporter), member 1/2/3